MAVKASEQLEKRAKSGIIGKNRLGEIPDMSMTAAPRRALTPKDVTEEYFNSATPNSHTVQDMYVYEANGNTYTVDGRNVVLDYSPHEKEVAELLEQELGGEISMVPRVNSPQGVSTPDYIFRGKGYDLKTIGENAGKNTIWNRIKKAGRQAHNFIIDLTDAKRLSNDLIDRQLEKIYRDTETLFVETMIIIRDGKIVKILERQ